MRLGLIFLVAAFQLYPQFKTHLPEQHPLRMAAPVDLLDDTTFRLLKTHPHLAVARYALTKSSVVDIESNMVKVSQKAGSHLEIQCATLSDGMRRTTLGSDRTEITIPCSLRSSKGSRAGGSEVLVTVERDGSRTLARLRHPPNTPGGANTYLIGNRLPEFLPARFPDFGKIRFGNVQVVGVVYGSQGEFRSASVESAPSEGHVIYVGFESDNNPETLVDQIKAESEASGATVSWRGDNALEFSNVLHAVKSAHVAHMSAVLVGWAKGENGKWIYEIVSLETPRSEHQKLLTSDSADKNMPHKGPMTRGPASK